MRVVNSTEAPPEFQRPDFSLPHLIDVGQSLVQEQRRVQEMRLAEEYNKSLYFNRKLGDMPIEDRSPQPRQRVHAAASDLAPARSPAASNGHASTSPLGQPSATRLSPDVVAQVNQIIRQGQRLGIEWVDDRRFRTNAWHSFGSVAEDGAAAIAAVEACLNEHPQDYVRLVAISPSDRRRFSETVIQRSAAGR